MRLTLLILFTFTFILSARDNPFVPANTQEVQVVRYNTPLPNKVETDPLHKTTSEVAPNIIKPDSKPKIHPPRTKRIPTTVTEKKKTKVATTKTNKEVFNFSKARFVFKKNRAYIETKDKIAKHFSISNPPSIVIDFISPSDFGSKRKMLATAPFKKLEIGAHGGRYRVVLRLDKQHKYKIGRYKYGRVVKIIE